MLVVVLCGICFALILLDCAALSSLLRRSDLPITIRVGWIVAVLVTHCIGSLLWFRVSRSTVEVSG